MIRSNIQRGLTGFLLAAALTLSAAPAAVQYVDFNSGTWTVDPAYSSAPINPSAPSANYTTLAPRKTQGVPITCFAAKPGGGLDVIFTYGGFQVQPTTRTEQYKAFAYNFQTNGNQEAFWGAKVSGGLDYLYYESGDVLKYAPASNLTGTYNALAPANAGTLILSSYGARAAGGIDFLYYDSTADQAVAVDTGLNSSTVYTALSLNTAAGNANAFWGARVGGGVDYMYYTGAAWLNLPLSDHLDGKKYLAFAGADGSGLDVGTYAARADGGIDLISITNNGTGGWKAVVNNDRVLGSGKAYSALVLDRSGLVPGDFFALTLNRLPVVKGQTNEAPAQFGNFVPQPSNTGRDWTPKGTTIYSLRADAAAPVIVEFGLDTEGGDRAKTQLLREPMRLVFTLADGRQVDAWDVPAKRQLAPGKVDYQFNLSEGIDARWSVWTDNELLRMSLVLAGAKAGQVTKSELLIPFDPRAMGTTILAEEWGANGEVKAPLIISALDMGQLRLSNTGSDEALACRFTGSRLHKRIDLRIGFPVAGKGEIVFAPARLEKPRADISDADWAKIRRGLISLIHITPFMPAQENGSAWLGSPGGITGNNVISDPVSCMMERNFQWLTGMGDKAVIMGIDLNKIARKTLEFWLNQRMNADGSLDYVLQKGNISADSNTGVLNAATDYYLSTGDKSFVSANKDALVKAVGYLIARDLDDDGLIETFRDGNGKKQFGDTGYDTICSGWKNALVNGQAYKSFLGVAKMMEDAGDTDRAKEYRQRALRLRQAYNKTFFQPEKNRYLWWIGQDGKRHDYINPLIQENAVLFGIADGIEADTGLPRGPRDVMQALWDAFEAAEYRDSAKGKTVDYIDSKTGNYTGFYWGIPVNLEDVPDDYNFQHYGTYEFPYYCNGGIFPQDAVAAVMAFSSAGMNDKAGVIRRELFRRQHEGILPNGSGFYMGVVNEHGKCYSILKWDGTPTDYEGIISRDCSFLQSAILIKDPAHALFVEGAKMKP